MASVAKTDLILKLYEIDTVKFGSFTLKSGISSPLYIDFRGLISEPEMLVRVSELLWMAASDLSFVSICGVPYTALPLATLMSGKNNVPMLIRRKEAKSYGTKKLVEGRICLGDVCLIVEDVVTTGSSILETAETLKSEGVVVKDAVVLLDREQGGREQLKRAGIKLRSVFTVTEFLDVLLEAGKVNQDTVEMVKSFLAENQLTVPDNSQLSADSTSKVMSHGERVQHCRHPVGKRLFGLMDDKKTNLAFAADTVNSCELLELADRVGPYICVLKTHADLLRDFSKATMKQLQDIARRHQFLILEDRKFADIGETVREQYTGGMLAVSEWSDFVTVHSLPGPGVFTGLKQVDPLKGCVVVAELSSARNLITDDYVKSSVTLAEENRDFVFGFVCQSRVSDDPGFVYLTPGVHLEVPGDSLGQQYRTPHDAIAGQQNDIIIVGRGIRNAPDPVNAAKLYRDAGYAAYMELLQ